MLETILVLGGSSSGKSEIAEELAKELESSLQGEVFYLATGVNCDREFAARIKSTRSGGPGTGIPLRSRAAWLRYCRTGRTSPAWCW